ncbi:MAG: hypothetical protein BWY99_01806 [Synergistetes bacterium ADurb.BinA166]|nr:MAG: hypothetical protein BWY99_01806 [Synergistetes bacterium ADurb.BinA166]
MGGGRIGSDKCSTVCIFVSFGSQYRPAGVGRGSAFASQIPHSRRPSSVRPSSIPRAVLLRQSGYARGACVLTVLFACTFGQDCDAHWTTVVAATISVVNQIVLDDEQSAGRTDPYLVAHERPLLRRCRRRYLRCQGLRVSSERGPPGVEALHSVIRHVEREAVADVQMTFAVGRTARTRTPQQISQSGTQSGGRGRSSFVPERDDSEQNSLMAPRGHGFECELVQLLRSESSSSAGFDELFEACALQDGRLRDRRLRPPAHHRLLDGRSGRHSSFRASAPRRQNLADPTPYPARGPGARRNRTSRSAYLRTISSGPTEERAPTARTGVPPSNFVNSTADPMSMSDRTVRSDIREDAHTPDPGVRRACGAREDASPLRLRTEGCGRAFEEAIRDDGCRDPEGESGH